MSMELFEVSQKKWGMYSDIELSDQQIRDDQCAERSCCKSHRSFGIILAKVIGLIGRIRYVQGNRKRTEEMEG